MPSPMAPFRYRKPGYVALNVRSLERSVHFYRDLVGLTLEGELQPDTAFLRCSDDHHNLVLYPSAEAGIQRMAFELESHRIWNRLATTSGSWVGPCLTCLLRNARNCSKVRPFAFARLSIH